MRALLTMAGLVLGTLLAGCNYGPPPALAAPDVAQVATALEPPPADRARVFVFTGRAPARGFTAGPLRAHGLPADISVNNIKVGTVDRGQVMVFDLVPGSYSFTWMIYNQKVGFLETMEPFVTTLAGGTIMLLSAELYGMTFRVSEGMMVSLLDASNKRLSPDMKVVRAALCPPSLCLSVR